MTDGQYGELIAYVDDRVVVVDGWYDHIRATTGCSANCGDVDFNPTLPGIIHFDSTNGRLLIPLHSYCSWCGEPYGGWSIIAIEGLATTFEILQTYTPTANEIGFRVPYMPEGFQYAESFDTYWGDLATVGDWSLAQPLQCGYPAAPPSVGDYLTVEDYLPPLDPGHGRYYITAVHRQGQTRYGRQSSGGVLTGRDPAALPACSE